VRVLIGFLLSPYLGSGEALCTIQEVETRMAKRKQRIPTTMPMRILDDKGIAYTPRPQARKRFTAEGVASDLGVPAAWVVKAMIAQLSDGGFVLIVIPGDRQLSLKRAGTVVGDKSVELANERDVQRVTGYQIGAVSVFGFRRDDVPSYIDAGVLEAERVVISSGRPDLGLEMDPHDLQRALDAQMVDVAY
jgi:Cys-tRNA(Pro)/Cys-tRNA(Cys) deacylase